MPCCLMAAEKWNIPKHELEAIVRCFLPDIQDFYQNTEGESFEEKWANQQAKFKEQNAKPKA